MNTKETAKKWNWTQRKVSEYCREGAIPGATKEKRNWDIPEDAPVPPLSVAKLCFLIDTAHQVQEGCKLKNIKIGLKESQINAGYKYLVICAFAYSSDETSLEGFLMNMYVTSRGKRLVDIHNKKYNDKLKCTVKTTLRLGFKDSFAEVQFSNEAN